MAMKPKATKRIKLTSRTTAAPIRGKDISDMMANADYLRHSSALIKEALEKGFDVLQLADGSIVTTGTKTVVYHYSWDTQKSKFSRSTKSDAPRKAKQMIDEDEDSDVEESEEA